MVFYYIASSALVPPAAVALCQAVARHGLFRPRASEEAMVWDTLTLTDDDAEVVIHFTCGAALPDTVGDWLGFAGRSLGPDAAYLLHSPSCTFRLEVAAAESLRLTLRRARFAAAIAAELVTLSEGLLVDAVAQRFWEPADVIKFHAAAFDVRDFVSVHAEADPLGALTMHTHGMARFERPDVEMASVPQPLMAFASQCLNEVCQHQAEGNVVLPGETVMVNHDYRFVLSDSSGCGSHCGNDVLALVDPWDAPRRNAHSPCHTLAQFARDVATDLGGDGSAQPALEWLNISLSLVDDDAAAYRERAALLAAMGRDHDSQADLRRAQELDPR